MPVADSIIPGGSFRSLARAISLVENEAEGYMDILLNLPPNSKSIVIGVTGPPGAGKSTLIDALLRDLTGKNKQVGVICVDPSSPFSRGALLGDRIRMSDWYNHPGVFIRSLATRGSLGGLNPAIISITDVMKAFGFDYIIIETVGVGQSEVEIAGLADTTVVVLVPEAGDEVQTMKAGLMEIADIFVVNKADRPDADAFVRNLKQIINLYNKHVPVVKTIASTGLGIDELLEKIQFEVESQGENNKRIWLLAERAYQLIAAAKMSGIKKQEIYESIKSGVDSGEVFNLYKFVEEVVKG